jgi:hypothetical protein
MPVPLPASEFENFKNFGNWCGLARRDQSSQLLRREMIPPQQCPLCALEAEEMGRVDFGRLVTQIGS